MIINNNTVLSSEEAINYLADSMSKTYKKKFIYAAIFLIIGVSLLAISLILQQQELIILAAIVCAVAIVYIVFNIVDMSKIRKKVLINNPDVAEKGAKYSFQFRENSVKIFSTIGDKNKKTELSYQFLKAIYEYEERYELVFNETDVVIVLKSGFENNKYEEIFRKNITTEKRKIKSKIKA